MLDALRSFLTKRTPPEAAAARADRPPEIQLAACALLLELAHADGEFSAPERRHIEAALVRHFGLDESSAGDLIDLADAERRRSIDHFQFTRMVADQYDLGQKLVLAEVMWGVILADGHLADLEAHLVRRMAHLLQLQPGYLAEARRAASAPPPHGDSVNPPSPEPDPA